MKKILPLPLTISPQGSWPSSYVFDCTGGIDYGNVYSARPYESTRALKNFYLSAQFYNQISTPVISGVFTIGN